MTDKETTGMKKMMMISFSYCVIFFEKYNSEETCIYFITRNLWPKQNWLMEGYVKKEICIPVINFPLLKAETKKETWKAHGSNNIRELSSTKI